MLARRTSLLLLLTLAAASPALAQDTWSWKKVIPAGRAIEIKGINGDVTATAAGGNEVEVIARKTGERNDPADVRIEVVEHSGGVTICAIYPQRGNECLAGARGRSENRNNDVEVDFEIRVPRGVLFTGRTVNGSVRATGMTADVQATTVNGSVRVNTTGLAQASTVNGSITVKMGRANWSESLEFETVNGAITLELPNDLNAEVHASTVNGSLSSDWPMTVRGKWGPKRMNGRIGNGGRELALETVNGDIELRKTN
jgi:DUF4097 and DUF4098 domain-containing protein YvlB